MMQVKRPFRTGKESTNRDWRFRVVVSTASSVQCSVTSTSENSGSDFRVVMVPTTADGDGCSAVKLQCGVI